MSEPHSWRGLDILVVSPTPTHPLDHGNRKRIYEICRRLQQLGARIHFVHYPGEHDWRNAWPERNEAAMRATWDSYHLVAPSRPLHTGAEGEDHDIDEWADPALTNFIAWACRVRSYDAVLVNYTWMSFCLDAVPHDIFRICDTHDVFGDRRLMLAANGIEREFFHTTPEGEAKGLSRAHLVWAIKDSERVYFEEDLNLRNCLTVLHAEPERGLWTRPPSRDGWLRAGMIGARNNVNRRNFETFLREALPVVEGYMAPVKIVLAGSCCDDFEHWRHPNLEILGRLDDVADFYRNVDVVIAPMQFSTGLKIKVSEALATGAPLIAHTHATEGYPTDEPLHLLDSFKAMAVELAKLAFDPSGLSPLAESSHRVCGEIQRSVDLALDETRRRIAAKHAATVCVVIPLEAFDRRSFLFDHLICALEFLGQCANLTIYVMDAAARLPTAEREASELLGRLGLRSQIFVDPALFAALGAAAPQSWTPVAFDDLLATRGFERAYVMSPCRDPSQFRAGRLRRVFLRCDAIELAGGDPEGVIGALRGRAELVVIGASSVLQARWRDAPNVAAVLCAPWRRDGLFESVILRDQVDSGDKLGGVVILAAENDGLAEDLAKLANRLGADAHLLDPRDPATAWALTRPFAASGPDPLRGLGEVKLLVTLTDENPVGSALIEAATRRNISCVSFQRGGRALGLHRVDSPLKPTSVLRLFRTVSNFLLDPVAALLLRLATLREMNALIANDAGWRALRQLLDEAAAFPAKQEIGAN